ncbi:MAG: hypothetical protein ACLU37_08595 [Collinsella sp.]
MDLLIDILLDAGKDTLALVPFLLVTYLALEALEHVMGDRVNGAIKRAGAAGPVVGCCWAWCHSAGFGHGGDAVRLHRDAGHAGRRVPLDLDEMLALLLAEQVPCRPWRCCSPQRLIALVTGLSWMRLSAAFVVMPARMRRFAVPYWGPPPIRLM